VTMETLRLDAILLARGSWLDGAAQGGVLVRQTRVVLSVEMGLD